MPCIGNLVSGFATDIVERFDHWIAFVLLGFLGLHMIWESRTEQEIPKNPLKNSSLLLAAIATSIDALAACVTLAAVDTPILFSSAVTELQHFCFRSAVFLSVRSSVVFSAQRQNVSAELF